MARMQHMCHLTTENWRDRGKSHQSAGSTLQGDRGVARVAQEGIFVKPRSAAKLMHDKREKKKAPKASEK